VSYRAVITGPRIQLRIAEQQNKLAERQQELHEKQFALSEQQFRFAIFGAVEQKWISDFQEMMAHLFELANRASTIHILLQDNNLLASHFQEEQQKLISLRHDAGALISRIWLHLGAETQHATEFVRLLRQWFFYLNEEYDPDVWVQRQTDIFVGARKIIAEHQEKIGFKEAQVTSAEREQPQLPTFP
jgi:hypothetical protein